MFCTGCGKKLPEGAVKCDNCGKVVKSLSQGPARPQGGAGGASPGESAGAESAKKPAAQQSARPQAKKQASPQKSAGVPANKQASPPAKKQAAPPAKKQAAPAKAPKQPPPGPSSKQQADDGPEAKNIPHVDPVFSPIEHDAGVNLGRALSFVFKDEDWLKKSLIVGLALFVPILNFFSIGFFVQLARKVSNGIELPLPEIEFAEQWKSGLMYGISFYCFNLGAMGIIIGLGYFAQLPIISIFAVILLAAFSIAFLLYFTGAAALSIIEGNPWLLYSFPECAQAVMENLTDVITVSIVIMILSMFFPLIVPAGFLLCANSHIYGQLARIMRSRSKF